MAKIMIVDDSSFMRDMIDKIVKEEGYEVVQAADGKDMLDKYAAEKPDVVIMDVIMPVMDGISAIDELHKIDKDAKILMCSAQRQKFIVDEAMSKGALAFIDKPFEMDEILKAIEDILNN